MKNYQLKKIAMVNRRKEKYDKNETWKKTKELLKKIGGIIKWKID